MPSEPEHSEQSPQHGADHPGGGYEHQDANVHALVWWGLGVFVLIAAGVIVSAVVFRYDTARQALGPPPTPFENSRTLPPGPRLQVYPEQDLERYREKENAELETYGWVDQSTGVVHIPIERAMDLLLERGLRVRSPLLDGVESVAPRAPASPAKSPHATRSTAVPAVSGSGRTP
jgi:hypothetical protein